MPCFSGATERLTNFCYGLVLISNNLGSAAVDKYCLLNRTIIHASVPRLYISVPNARMHNPFK